jgi:hypothetical protein
MQKDCQPIDSCLVVQKNLLMSVQRQDVPESVNTNIYLLLKYEIVIINKTSNCIENVQISDSFINELNKEGLFKLTSDAQIVPSPPIVHVEIDTSMCDALKGSVGNDLLEGNLLKCSSKILPYTTNTLILTIRFYIKQFNQTFPLTGGYMNYQNTIVLRGNVCKQNKIRVPIFPIYATSGISQNAL